MTDDEMWALIAFMTRTRQKMSAKIMHVIAHLKATKQPRTERTMTTPVMLMVDGVMVRIKLSQSTIHRLEFKWLWDPRYDPPADLLARVKPRTKPAVDKSFAVILAERDALKKENKALLARQAIDAQVIKHLAKKNA